MARLDLQFAATVMSFGKPEKYEHYRRTFQKPTKSMIVGVIARAEGIYRDDTEELNKISNEITDIYVHKHDYIGTLRDDQIVHNRFAESDKSTGFPSANGGVSSAKNGHIASAQIHKDYLIDTVNDPVIVTISGTKEFLEKVKEALMHPVWPVYLGRYCCIPAKPLLVDGNIY